MDYARLKEVIDLNVRPNGRQAITGYVLNAVLNAVLEELGAGWQFGGAVTAPSVVSAPSGGEDAKVFWLLSAEGSYVYGGQTLEVTDRAALLLYDGGEWTAAETDLPNGAAVHELELDISSEALRATAAEGALGEGLTAETERAKAREDGIAADLTAESARAQAKEVELAGKVSAETDRATAAEEALGGEVDGIAAKIPAQASAANKLADKEFVNSSISTATATFRGTFASLEELKATEADRNDYAFWAHTDAAGNTCYDKYTYDGAEWAFEYRLNNSSFTAAQWAAINSGATAEEVAKIGPTAEAVTDVKSSLAEETEARTAADEVLQSGVDAAEKATADEETRATAAETELGERIAALAESISSLTAAGYSLEAAYSPQSNTSRITILVPEGKESAKLFWLCAGPGEYTYAKVGTTTRGLTLRTAAAIITYNAGSWGYVLTDLAFYSALGAQWAGHVANGGKLTAPEPYGKWWWLLDTADMDTAADASYSYGSGKTLTLDGSAGGLAVMTYSAGSWGSPVYLTGVVGAALYNQLAAAYVAVSQEVEEKQDTLVSGTTIKTVNGESLLGSGDVTISGGGVATMKAGSGTDAEVFNGLEASAASGQYSHAEGETGSVASGRGSHSEGSSRAVGRNSHAEGNICRAEGTGGHAEGYAVSLSNVGNGCHAEGFSNAVTGAVEGAHVEGEGHTVSYKGASTKVGIHVEGRGNSVKASTALAHGLHVCGAYAPTVEDASVVWVHGCGASASTTAADVVIAADGSVYVRFVGNWNGETYDFGSGDVASLQQVLEDFEARIAALEAK